jgi:CheY-like chemotaxis protein
VPEGDGAGEEAPFYESLPGKEDSGISGRETILIAEDEDVLREMLAAFMRSLGYTVVAAHDGDEAFRLYNAEPERYDLVISDMLMPGKRGIALFQEIRSVRPQAKFVLVTGYSLAEVDEHVLAQMTAIIRKPYTPMQIVRLARDIFDA